MAFHTPHSSLLKLGGNQGSPASKEIGTSLDTSQKSKLLCFSLFIVSFLFLLLDFGVDLLKP